MAPRDAVVSEIPRLRRYARALTGNATTADDLVQDTLERALKRFALFRPGDLRAWLFTIMHNLYISQTRAAQPLIHDAEAVLAELPAPDTAHDRIALADLDHCLQQLPVPQREALLLVALEELSYEDTARVTGVPVGTVMSRLSRARTRLRALLADGQPATPLQVVK